VPDTALIDTVVLSLVCLAVVCLLLLHWTLVCLTLMFCVSSINISIEYVLSSTAFLPTFSV